jgi:hypothetical protein
MKCPTEINNFKDKEEKSSFINVIANIMIDEILFDELKEEKKIDKTLTATEEEMIEYCDIYACSNCTIAYKCSMFYSLFKFNPKKEDCEHETIFIY